MAQRLTCLLHLTDDEERLINAMATTLKDIRQAFRQNGVLVAGEQEQARILAGICAMEGAWSRYPVRHLEACYEKEILALYRQTTALIEQKTRDGGPVLPEAAALSTAGGTC